jgi:ribosomal protein L11 methyltransferase
MPSYRRLRFRVPPADEELLSAWLWNLGTEGIESVPSAAGETLLVATFCEEKLPVKEELADLAQRVPGIELVDSGAVEERDWLAVWREAATPIPLGEKLLVDPREWEPASELPPLSSAAAPRAEGATGHRFVLRIPARTAFGVGSHESTRLAYELLETAGVAGKRVLDVGCGSGILAMAALILGAESAVGFDLDPAAALLASQYARQNAVLPFFYAGTISALHRNAGFDVVVLNVLPHEIAEELEAVIGQLAKGGELLVSGTLSAEADAVTRAIEALGCARVDAIETGEWTGLRFRKRAGLAKVAP